MQHIKTAPKISCMGGMCSKRDTCHHYANPTHKPYKNLCNTTGVNQYVPINFQPKEQK